MTHVIHVLWMAIFMTHAIWVVGVLLLVEIWIFDTCYLSGGPANGWMAN